MGAYGGGDSAMVGIGDYELLTPKHLALLQNYPNPFNAGTTIKFDLPYDSHVIIDIYDILGRRTLRLLNEYRYAGRNYVTWESGDYPSGVYFVRLEAGERSENIKMVLLK